MHGGIPQDRRAWPVVSPVSGDRILIGLCAAIWLVFVGMGAAATVALVDLDHGFRRAGNPHTPAALYAVIIVSTVVILAAIPVLVYARRRTMTEPGTGLASSPAPAAIGQSRRHGYPSPGAVSAELRTERLSVITRVSAPSKAAADRIWLRGTVILVSAIGTAQVAVAAATYLMVIGRESAAWASYAVAGVITMVMPVIPWLYVRQLRRVLESPLRSG